MSEPVTMNPPLKGSCLCGSVGISISRIRPGVDACHCDMCRRWGGGPFFSLHHVKEGEFTLSGEEHVHRYASSDWAERASCGKCGSNLWYYLVPGKHWSFLAGLFDLPQEWQLDTQIFVDEMAPYAALAADSPKMTGAEVIAEAKAEGYEFD